MIARTLHTCKLPRLSPDRPCLVLGTAPEPNLPRDLTDWYIVCANYAGFVLHELKGRARCDLTVMSGGAMLGEHKAGQLKRLRDLGTDQMVLISDSRRKLDPSLDRIEGVFTGLNYACPKVAKIENLDVNAFVSEVLGINLVGSCTTGVRAACIAAAMGLRPVLCGISVNAVGHYYDNAPKRAHHVEPDRQALEQMSRLGNWFTTSDPSLHTETGIPMFEGSMPKLNTAMVTVPRALRNQYRVLHDNKTYGDTAGRHEERVKLLLGELNAEDVIDYGAGRAVLKDTVERMCTYIPYDPAIDAYQDLPEEPADVVLCIDVMEHVLQPLVEATLMQIRNLTKRRALFVISCREARHRLPDGRNCHATVRLPKWWRFYLQRHFDIITEHTDKAEYVVEVQPKD